MWEDWLAQHEGEVAWIVTFAVVGVSGLLLKWRNGMIVRGLLSVQVVCTLASMVLLGLTILNRGEGRVLVRSIEPVKAAIVSVIVCCITLRWVLFGKDGEW